MYTYRRGVVGVRVRKCVLVVLQSDWLPPPSWSRFYTTLDLGVCLAWCIVILAAVCRPVVYVNVERIVALRRTGDSVRGCSSRAYSKPTVQSAGEAGVHDAVDFSVVVQDVVFLWQYAKLTQ